MIEAGSIDQARSSVALGALTMNTAATVAGQLFNAVFVVVTARFLDAAGYAGLSVGLTVSAFALTLFVFGMDRLGIVVLGEIHPDERGPVTLALLALAMVAAACAGMATALALVWLPGVPAVTQTPVVVVGFALLTAFEVVRVASCELPRVWLQHRRALMLGNGARMALTGVLLVPFGLLIGLNIEGTLAALVLASFVLTVTSVRATTKLSSVTLAVTNRVVVRRGVTSYLRGGTKLSVANIAWLALGQADVLIVAAYFDVQTVAAYALATRLVNFLNGGLVAANLTVLPLLARTGRDRSPSSAAADDERLLRSASSVVVWPLLVLALGMAASAPWAIPAIFGDGYAETPAFIRLLVLGQLVNLATGLAGSLLLREGRTSLILVFNVGVCVVVLGGELVAAGRGSVEGVAVLSAFGTAALNLLMYGTVRRRFGINTAPYVAPGRAIRSLRSSA